MYVQQHAIVSSHVCLRSTHPSRFLSFPHEHVRVDLAVFLCAIAATRRLATSCRPIFHIG